MSVEASRRSRSVKDDITARPFCLDNWELSMSNWTETTASRKFWRKKTISRHLSVMVAHRSTTGWSHDGESEREFDHGGNRFVYTVPALCWYGYCTGLTYTVETRKALLSYDSSTRQLTILRSLQHVEIAWIFIGHRNGGFRAWLVKCFMT